VMRALTERKEWKFFAVLPKADAVLAAAWWAALILRGVLPAIFAGAPGVVWGGASTPRVAAGALRDRDRRVGRRGAARRLAHRAAGGGGRGLHPAAGAVADSPGDQRQPRRSDRGVALRSPHRCVRTADGDGASREPGAGECPDR